LPELDAECIETGEPCADCVYGNPRRCPILGDPEYRSYLAFLRESNRRYYEQREMYRERLADILRRHKVPLHYQVVARIYADKHRDFPLTERGVYHHLGDTPGVAGLGSGIYVYRPDED
jgi:hypothetical protein